MKKFFLTLSLACALVLTSQLPGSQSLATANTLFVRGLFADASGLRARACFRSGEIHILDSTGNVERVIPLDDTNRQL
jgi:hypothetical protein